MGKLGGMGCMGKLGGMGKLWAMGRNINLMSCVFTSHMDFNLDLDLGQSP